MRIGIDARYLSHGLYGGVHTYVRQLLPQLFALGVEHEFVLYADRKAPFELPDLPGHVRLRLLPYGGARSLFVNDLLRLPRAMLEDGIELMHFPANYGYAPRRVRVVVTLHDAINVLPLPRIIAGHARNARTMAMMGYLHLGSTATLRRAALVLTVSEYSRREIARVSGYDAARIVAVHHGVAPHLHPVTDTALLAQARARYGITAPFVLADALKNSAVLVRAWRRLPASIAAGHRLVLFSRGQPPPAAVEAERAGIATIIVRPPHEDLVSLYSMAAAFAFPSWIEGFGLPLLEAMTCGAPIVASDRGAIPEVLGDAGLVADAEDAGAIAAHLTRVLGDPGVAAALRRRGFARARGFTWAEAARRTLQGYQEAASSPGYGSGMKAVLQRSGQGR